MNKGQSSIINGSFTTFLLCVVAIFLYINNELLITAISHLSAELTVLVFVTIALQMLIRTKSELIHYHALNYTIPFRLLFLIHNRQYILNYLPMKAGTIYTAFDLKGNHKVSFSHFSSILISQHIIIVAVTLITSGVILTTEEKPIFITSTLIFSGIGLLTILWLRLPLIKSLPKTINDIFQKISRGISIIREHPGRLIYSLILRLVGILFMTLRIVILFDISGITLTFGEALLLSASVLISLAVSLTPAGLGIRELFLAFTSEGLGVSTSVAVLVSLLERAFSMIFSSAIVLLKDFVERIHRL